MFRERKRGGYGQRKQRRQSHISRSDHLTMVEKKDIHNNLGDCSPRPVEERKRNSWAQQKGPIKRPPKNHEKQSVREKKELSCRKGL